MPPVGQNCKCGSGLASDSINLVPPEAEAGKNFIVVKPASLSVSISETVLAPGNNGKLCTLQASIIKRVEPGLTAKRAPALAAALAFDAVNIVCWTMVDFKSCSLMLFGVVGFECS